MAKREPDFENVLKVLRRQAPARPTLLEIFVGNSALTRLAGADAAAPGDPLGAWKTIVQGYRHGGFDHAKVQVANFAFKAGEHRSASTISQNEGAVIGDWRSFEAYDWPDPDKADFSLLERIAPKLPGGMKLIVTGPGGALENAIRLVGYERLCLMTMDDPPLVERIFEEIGLRLVRFYRICLQHEAVGAIVGNDDWGHRGQTLFSPRDMRRYVFPWHKKIVEAAHAAGRPAILHSCGNLLGVMDDVIDEIGYDGKHSYEDTIQPVEEAYEQFHERIAIIGGIDIDFICRSSPEQVRARSRAMLERSARRGGYAL